MLDLLVVGAGLSGMMAAYRAARRGLSVRIIARGLGALHWSAGTVDLLGYWPDPNCPVPRPLESIAALAGTEPRHPYGLVGLDNIGSALDDLFSIMAAHGLPYLSADDARDNWWLPSPVGAARPTYLAPFSQIAGNLSADEPILVVGFEGLRDFYPELIAENLSKQGHPARAAFLPYRLLTDMRDRTTVQLAGELDNTRRSRQLGSALGELVRPGERIGVPALMGLGDHAGVMQELVEQAGAPVFEIPTLPPSVPGIRFQNALRAELEQLGVRIDVNMSVVGFHAESDRVEWIETETSSHPLKHRARAFLLATGGILGGGIETDYHYAASETVLNLPLVLPPPDQWVAPRFFDPAGHLVFRSGIAVNRLFQPVDRDGNPVYSNVFAAGGLLAHVDPIRERSLEGIALATGWAAGDCAAERAQSLN